MKTAPPVLILGWLLAGGPPAVRAQSQLGMAEPAGAKVRFDAVSIKPCRNASAGGGGSVNGSPGRLSLECITVEHLIVDAYLGFPNGKPWPVRNGMSIMPIPPRQAQQAVKGGPGWVTSDRFTIDAKAEGGASMEMMRGPMMQEVLKDRFKLTIHRETREAPVYDLMVAKDGPKLQPAKQGSCTSLDPAKRPPPPRAPGRPPTIICGGLHVSQKGGLDGEGVTLDFLCYTFSRALDRDVIDQTGLSGIYEIHLALTFADLSFSNGGRGGMGVGSGDAGATPVASEPGGSIFDAVRKLGLQLQPGKRLAEFIAIDHVEKPSEN
jgi:uncharacterized protein (TIGR03435 family)